MSGFKPVYKIQGKVYHLIGSLLPNDNAKTPKFAQIYFMSSKEEQTELRMSSYDVFKPEIIMKLENMMETYNSYAKSLKYAMRNLDSDSLKVWNRILKTQDVLKIRPHIMYAWGGMGVM